MSRSFSNIAKSAVMIMAGFVMYSCAKDAPFDSLGDGVLTLKPEYRGDVRITTRGEIEGYTETYLNEKLVVYIENSRGVIRKYIGKDKIPDAIILPKGNYVVEGWTGDSVSASFDKKFFRGYTNNVKIGDESNELSLKLDIANVVVAVDKKSLNQEIKDLKVKVYHSRGELEFGDKEITSGKRGYFMMPSANKDLNFIIEGTKSDGSSFSKSGEIKNVERSHLYNLVLSAEQSEIEQGGVLIRLEIQDIPLIEEYIEILPGPSFKAIVNDETFDLENQISSLTNEFKDVKVRALVYQGLESLSLTFSSNFKEMASYNGKNLVSDESLVSDMRQSGIKFEVIENESPNSSYVGGFCKAYEAWLTFTSQFLNNLEKSDDEFIIEIIVKDDRGYINRTTLKIVNSDVALADPIVAQEAPDKNKVPMAILATTAELNFKLIDESAEDFGIMYRESGSEEFVKVSAKINGTLLAGTSASKSYSIKIGDLKPGTTYEYKGYCDNFVELTTKTFKTENKYEIPNSSMEFWNKFNSTVTAAKNVPVPTDGNSVTFWDTGNHGSMSVSLMAATLTDSSEDYSHTGSKSAKLLSKFVGLGDLGKFAAGNLFIGQFARVDGTDGILNLGRTYNESHPSSLQVYGLYKPGKVQKDVSGQDFLKVGDTDKAQIYVALTTDIVEIKTKTSDRKLFNKDDPEVIAYGQITIDEDYNENGDLKLIDIPIYYKQEAKTKLPKYLIVVCAASKYGDYFVGGEGSVLYLDDFELQYKDIQFE